MSISVYPISSPELGIELLASLVDNCSPGSWSRRPGSPIEEMADATDGVRSYLADPARP
jgi:hypothetical protein